MTVLGYYPRRIVCLAAEAPEVIERLGMFAHIVAVSSHARRPAAVRQLPKVGGFANPDIDKILDLHPDLAITITDVQAEASAALVKHGVPVLALNPHRLADMIRNVLLIGGVLGVAEKAEALAGTWQAELDQLRSALPDEARPRVYFEEWPNPLVSGSGWVSDLIDWVGGVDIFRDLADHQAAKARIVDPAEVVARRPDVIVASWCGKKADLASIRLRPGWAHIPAVANRHTFELASDQILQTGPGLLDGARALQRALANAGSVAGQAAQGGIQ